MKTFLFLNPRFDAPNAYIKAMEGAGYVKADRITKADIVFIEYEPEPWRREKFEQIVKSRTVFIYPHTPHSYYLWDKWIDNPHPVACNFVVGEAAVMGMKAYGYPYRVEACGFSRCEVLPFKPTSGRNLLYASHHLCRGDWWTKSDPIQNKQVMDWIVKYRSCFDKVTVNYMCNMEQNGMTPYEGHGIDFVKLDVKTMGTASSLRSFKDVSLVIASDTFGYLAIASGIPTILVQYRDLFPDDPNTILGDHYPLYKSHWEYPVMLEDITADDIPGFCSTKNEQIERWKELNIGRSFDAGKFISVVKEFS